MCKYYIKEDYFIISGFIIYFIKSNEFKNSLKLDKSDDFSNNNHIIYKGLNQSIVFNPC